MLTIRAMVRVGPWVIETIERDDDGTHCERCPQAIKWIWVCRVDEDSPRLVELGGKAVWRIGSTCGPTLLMVSDEVWSGTTKAYLSAIKLIYRASVVLRIAAEREDHHWSLKSIAERTEALRNGTLTPHLKSWLSSHVGALERAYRPREADE